MGRFIFVSFFSVLFFLWEDFTDGTPVSVSLYSVRFHQHPAMSMCSSVRVSMRYMQ